MQPHAKRVRARVRGRNLELIDDLDLPAGGEVTVSIELPDPAAAETLRAIDESAGAWTDENHPDLRSRDDVIETVRSMRAAFGREHAG